MVWPSVNVTTTNLDAGTDSPATARANLLDLAQKFNQLRAHVSAAAQALLDDADAAAMRGTLGLGSLSVLSPSGTPNGTTFLRGDGVWVAIASAGQLVAANKYLTTQTWNKNSATTKVLICAQAAGGGGSRGAPGMGGAAGELAWVYSAAPPASALVTIGAGGAAGGAGAHGAAGGNTSVAGLVTVVGGVGARYNGLTSINTQSGINGGGHGGGMGGYATGTNAAAPVANSGAGGGGGAKDSAGTETAASAGAAGYVLILEFA